MLDAVQEANQRNRTEHNQEAYPLFPSCRDDNEESPVISFQLPTTLSLQVNAFVQKSSHLPRYHQPFHLHKRSLVQKCSRFPSIFPQSFFRRCSIPSNYLPLRAKPPQEV